MKNLSLINNIWIERINPNITDIERAILEDTTGTSTESKLVLINNIKARSVKVSEPEDAAIAQSIYDQQKIENTQLISVDISLPSGHGIINYKVNNEHKQIRF